MKNVKLHLAILVCSFVLLNGCSEDNITISQADTVISSETHSKNDLSVSAKGQNSFATGQGGFIFNGKHANFSFHASIDNEGNVSGQWEAKTVGFNLRTHGTIYCLSFLDDKTAIMSGIITQVNKDDDSWPGAQVGTSIWFKVVDNGEGNIDQFSDYYIGKGDCIDYAFPLVDITNGNIQVKIKTPNAIDIEGNKYKTVQIGSQIWMAENLKTTTYNDGELIPNVTGFGDWNALSSGGYAWYDNDEATNKNLYGALYNGYAVDTGKLAPEGWHIPTNEEWQILADYLGGNSVAGGKLKEKGITHWDSPNTDATNEVGFRALPGGFRDGGFIGLGVNAQWWTSTETSATEAEYRWVAFDHGTLAGLSYSKNNGFSIRCVKD